MKKIINSSFLILILVTVFGLTVNTQIKVLARNQDNQSERKIKIKYKPHAKVASCGQSSGLAILIVTFDKSAEVTETEVYQSSGCDKFDQNAIAAARGIKFEPEIKNEEAVTVKKRVEYAFRRY